MDAWASFLKKERDHVDAGGLPIIEKLLGHVEALKAHFNNADFHTLVGIIHRVHGLWLRLQPHITTPKYSALNEEITHETEELIHAKIINTATPEHLQKLLEKSYTTYTTAF